MYVTLITGAASGLGWAMARHWFAAGHSLVLADIDAEGLAARAEELGDAERVLTVTADITQAADICYLIDEVRYCFGRLDLLVNNAGITHRSPAHQTHPDVFRKVMAVDWQGPVELTMAALPLLRESGGSIVCIGSMAGWMPVPGRAAYCAAKGALTQFFEVLRLELEADGIHILMAYPSFLDTPIEHHALGRDGSVAKHPRSMVGGMRSAESMAKLIDDGLQRRKRWILPEPVSRFGSLLWRIAPSLYLRQVRKRFAGELR
ncbi:SDR family oxidoreductase [Pseudomonas sp. OIL-1]|uniref:SDR family oxidoreductase n=1 Tax=Pseudomonas sp. OIL-1 TaxID=2706126 RepID=UPI0013A77309|nr:SDR family oxidoreductase [Pseudomonas sp. OIL-1]QIB50953.1 SDR family oxidoreductase [Pseudomonas sp. OIL-1]